VELIEAESRLVVARGGGTGMNWVCLSKDTKFQFFSKDKFRGTIVYCGDCVSQLSS
jgi:hypothetical protein